LQESASKKGKVIMSNELDGNIFLCAADTNLIAVAPDLLATLESALSAANGDWNNGSAWDKKARAAIAKAKGEA